MPFDLGDRPARLRPVSRLIAEIGMTAALCWQARSFPIFMLYFTEHRCFAPLSLYRPIAKVGEQSGAIRFSTRSRTAVSGVVVP